LRLTRLLEECPQRGDVESGTFVHDEDHLKERQLFPFLIPKGARPLSIPNGLTGPDPRGPIPIDRLTQPMSQKRTSRPLYFASNQAIRRDQALVQYMHQCGSRSGCGLCVWRDTLRDVRRRAALLVAT
jgi:hypothetical protein